MPVVPRIKDPHAVPVVGHDGHLPAVSAAELSPLRLRAKLAIAHHAEPEIAGDGNIFGDPRPPAQAAVLVPLVQRPQGLQVLLTLRATTLRDHAGQISFPGGRAEPGDPGPTGTALREAQEEVGLDPASVEVVGRLPVYTTVTQFNVTPVVGLVTPPLNLRLDASEVAEAFEVPLDFLMNPRHHRRHRLAYEGGYRQFLSMPWRDESAAQASCAEREYFIWGATASMLRNLYRALL